MENYFKLACWMKTIEDPKPWNMLRLMGAVSYGLSEK